MMPKIIIIWVLPFLQTSLSSECQCSLALQSVISSNRHALFHSALLILKEEPHATWGLTYFQAALRWLEAPGVLSYYPRYWARQPAAAELPERGLSGSGGQAALPARWGRGAAAPCLSRPAAARASKAPPRQPAKGRAGCSQNSQTRYSDWQMGAIRVITPHPLRSGLK